MQSLFGAPAAARLLVAVFALVLAGCQTLSGKLKEDFTQAREISNKCQVIENAFALPTDEKLSDLISVRLRLKLTGSICYVDENGKQQCLQEGDVALDLGPIGSELDAIMKKLESARPVIGADLDTVKDARNKISESTRAIAKDIDAAIKAGRDQINDACGTKVSMQCGRTIATVLAAVAGQLRDKQTYAALLGEVTAIRAAADHMAAVFEDPKYDISADARAALAQLRDLAARAEAIFRGGLDVSGAVLSVDAQVVVDELFVHKLKYRAADRFITFSENQLYRADKIVDKADDKFLVAGSFALWFLGDSIQEAFDYAVDTMAKEALDKLDFALAFGRAGCDHLDKSPPPPGMFTPFLNRAIVKMVAGSICSGEMSDEAKKACEEKVFEVAKNDAQCIAKGNCVVPATEGGKGAAPATRSEAEQKASGFAQVISKAQAGDVAGLNSQFSIQAKKVQTAGPSSIERFQACYASTIAAQAGSLAGTALSAREAGELASRTCGAYVESAVRNAHDAGGQGRPRTKAQAAQPSVFLQALRSEASQTTVVKVSNTVNITNAAPVGPGRPAAGPCQVLERRVQGAHCSAVGESYTLSVPGLYREGEFQSERAYAAILQLKDGLFDLGGGFDVQIRGTASSSGTTCEVVRERLKKARVLDGSGTFRVDTVNKTEGRYNLSVPGPQNVISASCRKSEEANRFLALVRAAAAADLLSRGGSAPAGAIAVDSKAPAEPAPFVAAADRGLVVTVTRK